MDGYKETVSFQYSRGATYEFTVVVIAYTRCVQAQDGPNPNIQGEFGHEVSPLTETYGQLIMFMNVNSIYVAWCISQYSLEKQN